MALVSPIIFLMFLGAIELNNLNFVRNSAANAVYEGARAAMVSGGTSGDGSAAVMAYLAKVGVDNGVAVNVSVSAQDVTVSVTIPMQLNSFGISRFTTGYNVSQTITLSRETPGEAQ
jgi:Flp pilus assembly protein TadG